MGEAHGQYSPSAGADFSLTSKASESDFPPSVDMVSSPKTAICYCRATRDTPFQEGHPIL